MAIPTYGDQTDGLLEDFDYIWVISNSLTEVNVDHVPGLDAR